MSNETRKPEASKPEVSKSTTTPEEREKSKIAEEAAAKGLRTQKRYDRNHGTFPRGGPSGMA